MAVVMDGIPIHHGAQVPWPDDEHPVGHLGPDPADPAFAEGLCGGIFTASIPALANATSNALVTRPARSRTRNRNRAVRSARSISRFRACCTVHAPSGGAVAPRTCTWRVLASMTKNTYPRRRVMAPSTWK